MCAARTRVSRWRDVLQELRELGARGVADRARWELALRSGWIARSERPPAAAPAVAVDGAGLLARLPFAPARAVAAAVADRIPAEAKAALADRAAGAVRGRIRCFGRWQADFGEPVDWHLNPVVGRRWDPDAHWTVTLADTGRVGDVKLTWEVGRFPQAYELARAAALGAVPSEVAARALAAQIAGFVAANPYGRGVHWASGQEIAIRAVAWLFALSALRDEPAIAERVPEIAAAVHDGALHVERYLDYARRNVANNHLVSEALGLYLAGALLPSAPRAARWRELGLELLTHEAGRQFYADGGYLMHSHTYERAALQPYLVAAAMRRREGAAVPAEWRAAMARAADFLVAHQNPADGRLPNFGSNDGALPAVLSTCDFSDFRPLLQALSLEARGERLYPPGPWDEEAAWLLGPAALDAPLRPPRRGSASFPVSGFHVLRGTDPGTFASFRCGTLRHRFAQIDMLHLDLFWRGENVVADGGTYLYSGPAALTAHFTGGRAHNTVTVDGHDQMVHHRRFKVIYLTRARLLRFEDRGDVVLAAGEHDGFRRHPGRCVHRRAVLLDRRGLCVVHDRVSGHGRHEARLHWLCGAYPFRAGPGLAAVSLDTPSGTFGVAVFDRAGAPLAGDVVAGREDPPRGWVSRYYGEKAAAPSVAAVQRGATPLEFVSVLGPGAPRVRRDGERWRVDAAGASLAFTLRDGGFVDVECAPPEDRA